MSSKREKKKKFSVMLCKTDFDGRILEVKGRIGLVALILLLFSVGLGYFIVVGDIPIFVRVMMSVGVLITGYGFIDVVFAECYLNYDCESTILTARRGNLFSKASYEGLAEGRLTVTRVHASKSKSNIQYYTLVASVKLDDAIINYPLESLSLTAESSEAKIGEWEEKLNLN
ncbi:MAG: hypothetical protein P1V97_03115 [Planctomycetota bacterium]|nr:hypothetical protein [Planctomycetota bacterium]